MVKACFAGKKVIAVFDPSYLKKSGKKTYGVAKFYSVTAGKALKGLEASCLAFVGVSDHSALHALAEQSPTPQSLHRKGKTLVDHYAAVVVKHAEEIKALTSYVVVDGYFMKKDFMHPLHRQGLHVITKTRSDANLCYVYKGKQKDRGCKRIRHAKVEVSHLGKRNVKLLASDRDKDIYAGVVYSVVLKQTGVAAFLYSKDKKPGAYKKSKKGKVKPEIVISTDTAMKAKQVMTYYALRYQVEFLIRDAKSYAGLEDGQARSP